MQRIRAPDESLVLVVGLRSLTRKHRELELSDLDELWWLYRMTGT